MITVLAIALWAAPLVKDVGADVVDQGLRVALPLTLALQWGLRSRYFGRPKGLLEFGRHTREIALGACARTSRAPGCGNGSGAGRMSP